MRQVSSFVCQECGYDSPQWLGKCPECGTWNSLREFQVKLNIARSTSSGRKSKTRGRHEEISPKTLSEISYEEKDRLKTGFSEVDSVLGGGIVRGSITLLAGDPGIGKSTLLLQIAMSLAKGNKSTIMNNEPSTVLYISGEESEEQIKLRARRINGNANSDNFLLLSLNDTNAVIEVIERLRPQLTIIDSIQTMESSDLAGLSGSVGQVRYAAQMFIKTAKTLGAPIILVGHVTKEGMVAGPMVLSHMVDTVLFFEGEKTAVTRILKSLKNRFGPVDEVGVFTMETEGIKEVKNPQNLFLTERAKNISGSVITITLEGTRTLPVEIQALAVFSKLPLPRRVSSGIDPKRLELLIAVLQKHANVPLGTMDVFVNVAGGLKLSDPGVDLAICLAIFSSFKNIPMSSTVAISEVGLLGELRGVLSLEKRIKEGEKLGFKKIISVVNFKTISEVIKSLAKKQI